jgi:hypothetical protein
MPKMEREFDDMTFARLDADFEAVGIVGEKPLMRAIYMVGTSRLLDRPHSAIVIGKSSTGKSCAVQTAAQFFPPEDVIIATRMTPQALYHMGDLSHKFVVAGERSHVQDAGATDATAALRQLQSERHIVKRITERGEDGQFTTRAVEVKGPIAYVETTTLQASKIIHDDLTRVLLLRTDESEQQTRSILQNLGDHYGNTEPADTEAIFKRHREFQARLVHRPVTIPFAGRLMDKLPAKKVQARRAGQQVLSMIEVVTLFHQFVRETDAHGRLIATDKDYVIAAELLRGPLGESLGVKASPAAFYRKLAAKFKRNVFSTMDAQKLDAAGERTVRGWLNELAKHECVERMTEGTKNWSATWRLNGRGPEEIVLPSLKALGLAGVSGS